MSVCGTAEKVTDRDTLRQLWVEDWRVWFPEGPDTDNLCLLKVTMESGEYWDNSSLLSRAKFVVETVGTARRTGV